jgi:hypothetical protein
VGHSFFSREKVEKEKKGSSGKKGDRKNGTFTLGVKKR